MKDEKRKSVRRHLRYTAWIAQDGKPLLGCVMSDISQSGARLEAENVEEVPDEFVLMLSSRGSAQRKCKIAWRAEGELGVSFERAQPVEQRGTAAAKVLAAAKAKRDAKEKEAEPAAADDEKAVAPAE